MNKTLKGSIFIGVVVLSLFLGACARVEDSSNSSDGEPVVTAPPSK